MPSMKKEFVYYKDYAEKKLTDVFTPQQLAGATKLSFNYPYTTLLLNNGKAGFSLAPLPIEAQVAPVSAIEWMDVNHDNQNELIIAGNLFSVKLAAMMRFTDWF
jgi:enediyne biosynthesis protein E4